MNSRETWGAEPMEFGSIARSARGDMRLSDVFCVLYQVFVGVVRDVLKISLARGLRLVAIATYRWCMVRYRSEMVFTTVMPSYVTMSRRVPRGLGPATLFNRFSGS